MKRLLDFLLEALKPFRTWILSLMACAFFWAVLINIQPYFLKNMINSMQQNLPTSIAWKNLVWPWLVGYLVASGCYTLMIRFYNGTMANLGPKQKEWLTLRLMHHALRGSFAFYQKNFSGNLTHKINDIATEIPNLVKIFFFRFFHSFLILVLGLVNVALIQKRFAVALFLWLFSFTTGSIWLLSRHAFRARHASELRSRVVGHIVDVLANIKNVRLFGRFSHELWLLKKISSGSSQAEYQREVWFSNVNLFQGFSFLIFEIICCFWLVQGFRSGLLKAGDFILIFTLNTKILEVFWTLAKEIREFWEKFAQVQQGFENLYGKDILMHNGPNAKNLVVSHGHITFEHVHFFYEGSPPLFENKTLDILGQQKVGLVGYSGSGKSTFINLILRLYDVTSGRILIDGQDIRHVTWESLYQAITVIPQECYLFNRSIMDNIRYGRLDATDEEVYSAARRAQIHDVIEKLPKGYETLAGDKGAKLSGGQRQRIAIASAILKNSPILLMDEATSNLDALTEKKIKKAFDELMKGKTVLVIAHRLSTLENMDRILVFDDGKIAQDGSHVTLMEKPGLYRTLWTMQSQGVLSSLPEVSSSSSPIQEKISETPRVILYPDPEEEPNSLSSEDEANFLKVPEIGEIPLKP